MKVSSRILLISNSTVYGRDYLDHVGDEIKNLLGTARTVLFFPFALYDHDGYAAKAKARFKAMGYLVESAHTTDDPQKAIEQADAIFIGGGNTFRLLKALQDLDLIEPIRGRVKDGAPYIGSSAGSRPRQTAITCGQRGWKRQPVGQLSGLGALPVMPPSRARSPPTFGIEWIRPCV